MRTPWGYSDYETKYFEGVYDVNTPGHGGIMIRRDIAKLKLTAECIELGEPCGEYIAFEEDCLWAVPCLEWSELRDKVSANCKSEVTKDYCRNTVRSWYPEYFEKRYGIIVGTCPNCGKRNRVWCNCEYEMVR